MRKSRWSSWVPHPSVCVCISLSLGLSIETTSLHFWHQNLPHTFHKNKYLWTTSFFFHGPDTVELVTVWCSSLSINIFFQASLKNSSLQICIQLIPHHTCVCVCVCNIPLYIFAFAVYLLVSYMCAQISLVMFGNWQLWFIYWVMYVNSCVIGGRMAWNLFHFVHCMRLYIFLQLFVRRIVP